MVNNDPDDRPPSGFVLPPNALLFSEREAGSYAARNRGAAQASGEILSFTDADCLPDEAWIENILAHYTGQDGTFLLSGQVKMFSTTNSLSQLSFAESYDYSFGINQDLYSRQGVAATANLSVPRNVFNSLGGFNTALLSGGDTDFCLRAKMMHYNLVYSESAFVWHPLRGSALEILKKSRRLIGGKLANAGWRAFFQALSPPIVRVAILIKKRQPLGSKMKAFVFLLLVKTVQIYEAFRVFVVKRAPLRE